mgnify:CR=1 FL=1
MQVMTYEGIIENGEIRLIPNVSLPEKTRVYVVVPSLEVTHVVSVPSPRLAHPVLAAYFCMYFKWGLDNSLWPCFYRLLCAAG